MLFCLAATVLLFSRRDDEAVDLLGTRLRGMYDRLPDWLKVRWFGVDNDHEWALSNGSRVLAFPTTAGDSYTATLAIVDEADLVPDQTSNRRLRRRRHKPLLAKPALDHGRKPFPAVATRTPSTRSSWITTPSRLSCRFAEAGRLRRRSTGAGPRGHRACPSFQRRLISIS